MVALKRAVFSFSMLVNVGWLVLLKCGELSRWGLLLTGRLALSRYELIPVLFGHLEIDCAALDSCAAQCIECKVLVYLTSGASHQRAGDDSRNMCNSARVFRILQSCRTIRRDEWRCCKPKRNAKHINKISYQGHILYLFQGINMKKVTYQALGQKGLFKAIHTKVLAIFLDEGSLRCFA